MRAVKQVLGNQRGNVTVFVLTIFFFMTLIMFTLLYNMSTVFVDKEVAANSAQQASIAAVQIVYEEVEVAIKLYDASLSSWTNPAYISTLVGERMMALRASNPDWSESEVRYNAIDDVLDWAIPMYPALQAYIQEGLVRAQGKIPGVVGGILDGNGATRSGSVITFFDSDLRITVETSARYESETFGLEFLNSHTEQVKQSAQSRPIGFAGKMRWYRNQITL